MANDAKLFIRIAADNRRLRKDLAKADRQIRMFSRRTTSAFSAIKGQLGGFAAGFTAFQVGSHIIKSLAGLEQQMSRVKAISGASTVDMERFKEQTIEISKSSKFTAVEVGKMQEEFSRLGKTVPETLAAGEAISKLAIIAQTEMGDAARVMASTLNAFNLEATESERVANTMAESFTKSSLDMEKFTTAIGNVGAAGAAVGFSLERTTALLGVLTDSGIDASKAGTDLRRIFIELADQGLTMEQALEKIRFSQDKLTTSSDLFKVRASVAGLILSENEEKVKKLTAAFKDNNKELDEQARIYEDNLIGDWNKFTSALDAFLQKGSKANNLFRFLTKSATNWINVLGSEEASTWEKFQVMFLQFRTNAIAADLELAAAEKKLKESLEEEQNVLKGAEAAQRLYNESLELGTGNIDAIKDSIKGHINEANIIIELDKIANRLKEEQNKIYAELIAKTEKKAKADELAAAAALKHAAAIKKVFDMAVLTMHVPSDISSKHINRLVEGIGKDSGFDPDNMDFSGAIPQEFLDEDKKALDDATAATSGFMTNMEEMWAEFGATIAIAVDDAMHGMITAFATGGDIKKAIAPLVSTMGDGLITMGLAALGWGKLMESLQASLTAGIFGGLPAIAAGGIAIAAGAGLKALASKLGGSISGGGGGGGGGSVSGGGRFQGTGRGQTVIQGGEFIVRGTDLVYVLNRQNRLDNRSGG